MNQIAIPMRANAPLVYTGQQLDLIRRTVAADCNALEFDLYLEVAKRVGLDPFRKQIYAVVYNKKDEEKRKMSIITAIDGYRAVAARNRDYRPDEDPPSYEYDETVKSDLNPAGIVSATVRCWKLAPDGQWHKVAGQAFWEEFCPLTEKWAFDKEEKKRRPTGVFELSHSSNWYKMPRVMIAKVAEATALRRGWPEDLSGIYTEDEMARASAHDMSASEAIEAFRKDERLQLTGSKDAIFIQWAPDQPLEGVPLGQFADKAVAFVKSCQTVPDLVGWQETNKHSLQNFWARSKSDALELKKIIEDRIAEIVEAGKVAEPPLL